MTTDQKQIISNYFQNEMYGIWRQGETVSYELLGKDPKDTPDYKPANPFEVIGGELVKIKIEKDGQQASFIVHAFLPDSTSQASKQYPHGNPFIICMHPIMPKDLALQNGYALFFMDSYQIASDDINHKGAFYDLYPYTTDKQNQTGVLMAWAWGASKVLDAIFCGLKNDFNLDENASLVTGVSRWGKATAVCGAFDNRFAMPIPACSGAGGLALYDYFSEGKTYDFSKIGGPSDYTYQKNEPLSCLQSDAERGWFNDYFLIYTAPDSFKYGQENLIKLAADKNRFYFIIAACTGEDWVNAPAMWECYKKANSYFCEQKLSDHLVVNFHKEGHAVLAEDMELIISYFNKMYFGFETSININQLKTSVFENQNQ